MKKILLSLLLAAFVLTACSNEISKDTSESKSELVVLSFEPDEEFVFDANGFYGTLKLSIPKKDANESGEMLLEYKNPDKDIDVKTTLPYVEWMTTSYVAIPNDKEFYVLVQGCFSNDWRTTYILKSSSKDSNDYQELQLCSENDGGIASTDDISSDGFIIHSHTDIFGTYGTKVKIDYDGNLLSEIYEFNNEPIEGFWDDFDSSDTESLEYMQKIYSDDGRRVLTLISDLEGLDKNEQSVEIPSGSIIYPTGYSPKEMIFYFEYNGTPLHLYYTEPTDSNSYGHDINGVNEENIFAIMPYAG